MSFLQKLNPLYWLQRAKERVMGNTITKYVGGAIRTFVAFGLGSLATAGLLSPEQVEQASVAFGPVADAVVGLAMILAWSLFEKKSK